MQLRACSAVDTGTLAFLMAHIICWHYLHAPKTPQPSELLLTTGHYSHMLHGAAPLYTAIALLSSVSTAVGLGHSCSEAETTLFAAICLWYHTAASQAACTRGAGAHTAPTGMLPALPSSHTQRHLSQATAPLTEGPATAARTLCSQPGAAQKAGSLAPM